MNKNLPIILIRGGGDLASDVALRLHHVGLNIMISEHAQPLAVRRLVSFTEVVYRGKFTVEDVTAHSVQHINDIDSVMLGHEIPFLIDPSCETILSRPLISPLAIIDVRMTKCAPDMSIEAAPLVIGLGPGFSAGKNYHDAIETNRGHFLGCVIWDGALEADTDIPSAVTQHQDDRMLRAPLDGLIKITD